MARETIRPRATWRDLRAAYYRAAPVWLLRLELRWRRWKLGQD